MMDKGETRALPELPAALGVNFAVDPEEQLATRAAWLYFVAGLTQAQIGKKLGDPSNPLLVSVRSGAKFSMPGMMNTILNLGLNDETTAGLAARSGNERFAYDCYRRFIQMFGEVALNIEMEKFDHIFDSRKAKAKVKLDTELTAADLKAIIVDYLKLVQKETKKPFPQDPHEQLAMARDATAGSTPLLKQGRHRLRDVEVVAGRQPLRGLGDPATLLIGRGRAVPHPLDKLVCSKGLAHVLQDLLLIIGEGRVAISHDCHPVKTVRSLKCDVLK